MTDSRGRTPQTLTSFSFLAFQIVRGITGLGLKEAKEMVEKAPIEIKADATKDDGDDIKSQIEAVGGKVELK